jgi:hypothetical protein
VPTPSEHHRSEDRILAAIVTLVSTLAWVQNAIPGTVKGLTIANLDYLLDSRANSIGALLLHLAATETYYQLNTFDGMKWDSWPAQVKQKWDAAMDLGDAGRTTIKGHDLDYYLGVLKEAREKSLAEFRKRDDKWLMAVDEQWFWGLTNNYCKGFMFASTSRTMWARWRCCARAPAHDPELLWLELPGSVIGPAKK